jgi:4-amino-4-deoxy-L-arabinose transferase-like glycosyltransferase
MIIRKDHGIFKKLKTLTVLFCCCLPAAVWGYGLWHSGGWPFVREVLVVNNLMRFTGAAEGAALGHQHGLLYYLATFPRSFLPWTLLLIPALIASWNNRRQNPYLGWFLGPFILLSLASTKRSIYLLPLYPAAACMIGLYLHEAIIKARWEDILIKITWGIVIAGVLAPWAGIILGLPILGIGMGILALGGLVIIAREPALRRSGLALSLSMCMVLSAGMTVYFVYRQPLEDYLPFTRAALKTAGKENIIVLSPDEIFEGLQPMLTGKTCATVSRPEDVKVEGLYIWADKHDEILHGMNRKGRVEVLVEQKIGSKQARFARIVPARPDLHHTERRS